ncbi:MAG: ABC transporter permease subunit [Theionarchaea archaeon]|nr:MAG: hypothetical protein AYK19_01135 [Theionarchaea archaeon DG-70-1]MBU7027986.1 ABC transporter permease subunit [Theionarchaea archaeon]
MIPHGGSEERCTLCSEKMKDRTDSLYCGYCHAVFHRSCIIEHFYYNRFCPACKKKLSFIDMRYGSPPKPRLEKPLRDVQYELVNPEEYIPRRVRKPQWPVREEVPLFRITPGRAAYGYKPRRGILTRVHGFVFAKPEETTGILGRFRHNRKGMAGVYMLLAAVFVAILAPSLILYDPVSYMVEDETYISHPPTWQYPMGTDVFGRDIYSQTIWGFRSALTIALPSAFLIGVIGTVVGLVSGYYSGSVDAVLQRVSLTFLVWPSVPFVALIVFSWGGSMANFAVILGVAFTLWPTSARAIRAEVKSLKSRLFIESAKVSGASSRRVIFRHILPNVVHITFLYITIAVASALALEATFNFLGLSSPAVITWGQMLSFTYHAASARFGVGGGMAWWTIVPPALAIAGTVLSFFLISTGLRESMRVSSVKF